MDTSPNQVSEIEFEQLLAAASQARRSLDLLTGRREPAVLKDMDEKQDLKEFRENS